MPRFNPLMAAAQRGRHVEHAAHGSVEHETVLAGAAVAAHDAADVRVADDPGTAERDVPDHADVPAEEPLAGVDPDRGGLRRRRDLQKGQTENSYDEETASHGNEFLAKVMKNVDCDKTKPAGGFPAGCFRFVM